MDDAKAPTWTISEVQELVGLSRRDIQRCCYSGKGGVGLLSPKDGGWGHRTYDLDDLAILFLAAQRRREGKLLSHAARELKESLESHSILDLLADEIEGISDQLERLTDELIRARTLSIATDAGSKKAERLKDLRALVGLVSNDLPENRPPDGTIPSLQLADQLIDACRQ